MKYVKKYWMAALLLFAGSAIGQNCPPNIGFENGTFDGWECSAGHILEADGSLTLAPCAPIDGRHTMFTNTFPQSLDPFGFFPVNCPNGSGHSIRLGNSTPGNEAEGVSYTFTIPANNNDYSIIYNYAVVFENPNHLPYQQPRFTSKVYNVTDNQYIQCGSFEYVASSNLPGFQLSGDDVYYKPWSPVTVNLSGLAGKTIRLEFTTNDCAFRRHFGYAYLDVNEDCTSAAITGNTYCGGSQSLTLTGPYGFQSYKWYNADFSQLLGTGSSITFTPPPPANTTYALAIVPYDGLGCLDTLYTTIRYSTEPFVLQVKDTIKGCTPGVNLTDASITAGSTPGLTYSYFTDPDQLNYVATPHEVTSSGTYYIKGVNSVGCHDIKPVVVIVVEGPTVAITNPDGVCIPNIIDITNPQITNGSDAGLSYSYWKNLGATIPLQNPNAISIAGIYYIKGLNTITGCSTIQSVDVKIGPVPTVVIHDPISCGQADLTASAITSGSTFNLTYTYWRDTAATINLTQPKAVTSDGTYFIKASSPLGCSVIKPVTVTINPKPVFTVTDPAPVNYPVLTVDITHAVAPAAGIVLTYWRDSLGTKKLLNPTAIDKSGTYYIEATNFYPCSAIHPVVVKIIPSPEPIIYVPNAFTPNSDGLNDMFKIKILGEITVRSFKVYDRMGQMIFSTSDPENKGWNGKFKGIDQPTAVYVWVLDCYDDYYQKSFKRKGVITLVR